MVVLGAFAGKFDNAVKLTSNAVATLGGPASRRCVGVAGSPGQKVRGDAARRSPPKAREHNVQIPGRDD